ncbi:MAG: 1,4-dihydroxy-6-naphthoate synthase [Candidatus Scalindua sp.]|jgi:1,4-dihydroxy-6-naphthoate synthase|nr:1,4-dihydroxy-6-naphthoate synthase [Candidatus Scalindua sp.]MBT5304090.1 1,4-dihydroxy-6-naphthoate synthase [Candidatus Scalindua sp.]MBT6053046.1 1,4-dihydroxy-6-naphthoate synthase [Candidatus Scalindua sp.]MBT6225076.1 1,4-dihydroxy-6-naphthoate synthase [Candidatus Scalindua sp.]MBT6564882.1 1,4-dihydroxy-6-naphthoate synthase [Candidatus Scalindua sp.]
MKLKIGISPCPNDTFIFHALLKHLIDAGIFEFEVTFADVQSLNEGAQAGNFDIVKISYGNLWNVQNRYGLLYSGGAMGYGCGPLLLSTKSNSLDPGIPVGVPGKNTTANALLKFWAAGEGITYKAEYAFFNELYHDLFNGDRIQGLVIHENRFTYEQDGLYLICDLGEYWEKKTEAPIPLGGIVARRDIGKDVARKVDELIRRSVEFAWNNPKESESFIKEHAQETEESVVKSHIGLYVNDFSAHMGEKGKVAIEQLQQLIAPEYGDVKSLFAY